MAAGKKNASKKPVVLIVEDDEVLLRALYLIFHHDDYTIATASDGQTALDMTGRLKPDIVLLDLLLPKMNGFDYLKNLRSNTVLKDTPVIVLSNLGDSDNIAKAKSLGANDYLIKSNTDLTVLNDKVKKLLKI